MMGLPSSTTASFNRGGIRFEYGQFDRREPPDLPYAHRKRDVRRDDHPDHRVPVPHPHRLKRRVYALWGCVYLSGRFASALPYACAAASIGGGLADLVSGVPVWVLPTMIIKPLTAIWFTNPFLPHPLPAQCAGSAGGWDRLERGLLPGRGSPLGQLACSVGNPVGRTLAVRRQCRRLCDCRRRARPAGC